MIRNVNERFEIVFTNNSLLVLFKVKKIFQRLNKLLRVVAENTQLISHCVVTSLFVELQIL